MKIKIYPFFFIFILFFFSGCDALIDCIASASPQLSSKSLAIGAVGFSYNDFVEGSVKNDSNDNGYGYFFSIDGQIPAGLNYYVEGRKIRFSGIPNAAGTYKIRIHLKIDPPYSYEENGYFNDNDRICLGNDTTDKQYTIVIN